MRLQAIAASLLLAACSLSANDSPGPERQHVLLELLHQDCGSCHGLTLNGGLGPSLSSKALAGKPEDFLVTTIIDGRPGTAMPPWKPFMTKQEAKWLVDYLRGQTRLQQ